MCGEVQRGQTGGGGGCVGGRLGFAGPVEAGAQFPLGTGNLGIADGLHRFPDTAGKGLAAEDLDLAGVVAQDQCAAWLLAAHGTEDVHERVGRTLAEGGEGGDGEVEAGIVGEAAEYLDVRGVLNLHLNGVGLAVGGAADGEDAA